MLKDLLKELKAYPEHSLDVLKKVDENLFERSFLPHFRYYSKKSIYCRGGIVSSGVCSGTLVLDSSISEENNQILLTDKILPSQMSHFDRYVGIITKNEDATTHASIVARDKGLPVISIGGFYDSLLEKVLNQQYRQTLFSLDCFKGYLCIGYLEINYPEFDKCYYDIINFLKDISLINIHANADNIGSVNEAKRMLADGIQPRSEYLIHSDKGLLALRKVLFRINDSSFKEGLFEFEEIYYQSLFEMFSLFRNKNVIIRLLDPPTHEFLPKTSDELTLIRRQLDLTSEKLDHIIERLSEVNPMSGNRGVRLFIMVPELLEVQIKTILRISQHLNDNQIAPFITINIPMTTVGKELAFIKNKIDIVAKNYPRAKYRIGTMIETPAAALMPDHIFKYVDYISFGTNDLTAQTFAFSRGDVYDKFLQKYIELRIFENDPFSVLNEPVKKLIRNCTKYLNKSNVIKDIAICGEQSIEKSTIEFCINEGINIISCSPSKIPLTLLRSCISSLKRNVDEII